MRKCCFEKIVPQGAEGRPQADPRGSLRRSGSGGGISKALMRAAGVLLLCTWSSAEAEEGAVPKEPRIVNIYNFIRNSDYRVQNSEEVLFETTKNQIELIKPTKMPATWALQYDALINPKYQALLKEQLGPADEIAAWWEIPRQLAEKAGLKWRGHHDWDSTANIGFSPGYTPQERRKVVDVYMTDFKAAFGHYPATVGSWYIDEVTLEYMTKKYGIVASCNCKDQVGTDGYTLWGGYWNQAYYPSRVNAYMPAQTKSGQIDVPVFRMLGSDPIYQYGRGSGGMFTLEPVYSESGASAKWAEWFMKNMIQQPSLAFAYTQAGQENSFGWNGMKNGLTMQVAMLARQEKAGEIRVMTLAQAGKWFKSRYPLTPPTSMAYLDDWKGQGRKTVWYNSRFYRTNFLWQDKGFFIRDMHRFDEKMESVTHDLPLKTTSLSYGTLPIMDGSLWSGPAGMRPVLIAADGSTSAITLDGEPVVKEMNATDLSIVQPLTGGGSISVICKESTLAFMGLDGEGKPLSWGWDLTGGDGQKAVVKKVATTGVSYQTEATHYELKLAPNTGSCKQMDNGVIRLTANSAGKLSILLGE
jgi:hypothetical protein